MRGNFALMLHAHIPYCRKSGTWPAGEEWLFEAMYETYIPLLSVFRRFQRENIKPGIMVGIVPILAEQLADPYMNDRFCEYMENKINRAAEDINRFQTDPQKQAIAQYWYDTLSEIYRAYHEDFFRNILGTLKWLQEEEVIEVVTSAATHGFLPLLERDSAVFSQIHLGVETYKKYFDKSPKGFWLPECAYRPREWDNREQKERKAIDEWLAEENIQYFFVENVGITEANFIENKNQEHRPSTYRGYRLESGVNVFGRNIPTSKQVWSPDQGYPGDPYYREFHQKDTESGLHYWRVSGSEPKKLYNVEAAQDRVKEHARHFVELLNQKLGERTDLIDEAVPIIMAPYDAELFGHWWWEGVSWIESVVRLLAQQESIQTVSLSDYIQSYGDSFSIIRMGTSTWGENSDFTVWNSPEHRWLWPYINASTYDFERVLEQINTDQTSLTNRGDRILKQTGRELLLMTGSDWPFLLYTTQAKEYANQRFHHHHQRFNKLLWAAKDLSDRQRLGDQDLRIMEEIDNPWSQLDWKIFRQK